MEQKKDRKAFLEMGWKFPIMVDEVSGRIRMSSEEENIKDSIQIILGTKRGERIMEPEFGCKIWEYFFEDIPTSQHSSFDTHSHTPFSKSIDYSTLYTIKNEVEYALAHWEPRITEIHAEVSDEKLEQGLFLIHISYKIRSTNQVHNLVYPFAITEKGLEDSGIASLSSDF